MKININDFKIKNFSYRNLNFDFSDNGIYVIRGENGSGKTTLLKEMLFNKNNISFSNYEEQKTYNLYPYKIITYISQNIYTTDLNVLEYITKLNTYITIKEILEYFALFNIDENILKIKYKKISGGEKQIIHLIAGFLKNTRYLCIDEPTNNLDDERLTTLVNFFLKQKKEKTIILVSHDERINKISDYDIFLDENNKEIIKTNISLEENTFSVANSKEVKPYKYFFKLSFSKMFIITVLLIAFFLGGIIGFNKYYLKENINTDIAEAENFIISHPTGIMTKLTLDYAKYKKISIKEENLKKQITYKDFESIYKNNKLKSIFLKDTIYYNKIITELEDKHYSFSPYSVPYNILKNLNKLSRDILFPDLIEGNYPIDNKKEVVTSKEILKSKYNIKENPIGQEILIKIGSKEEKHKIVGLIATNIFLVSFNNKNNFGVYEYNKDTYNSFLNNNLYNLDDQPTEIIFEVNSNLDEKKLTNYLISNYHANESKSNYLFQYLKSKDNFKIFNKLILINSLVYILLSILFVLFNFKTIRYNLLNLQDIDNYFITKNKYKKLYMLNQIGIVFLVFLSLILVSSFLKVDGKLYFMLINLIPSAISLLIFCFSYILVYLLNVKKIN